MKNKSIFQENKNVAPSCHVKIYLKKIKEETTFSWHQETGKDQICTELFIS